MKTLKKISDFTLTMAQWIKLGCPTRDSEWVCEIFNNHCKPCEHYDPNGRNINTKLGLCATGICTLCDCHVSDDVGNPLNKILLPNTSCPDGKWDAIVK